MLCYVGKATKIFIFLVATLAIVGLFVAVGIHHHTWAHKARPTCQGDGGGNGQCSPVSSFPDPATAASVPPPLLDPTTGTAATSPPLPSIPDTASVPLPSPNPTTGTAATSPALPSVPAGSAVAAPPPVFSPPSPVTAAPGPGQA